MEKQKLIAMQLHLHLSENKYTDVVCLPRMQLAYTYSLIDFNSMN